MRYEKQWLTYEEQADLLIVERGLLADRDILRLRSQKVCPRQLFTKT